MKERTLVIDAELDRLGAHGLTSTDIQQALKEAGIDPEAAPESLERLDQVSLTNAAGERLLVRDVAGLTLEERERPVVIDRR